MPNAAIALQSSPVPISGGRFAAFDGLRGVAVLAVVLYHCAAGLKGWGALAHALYRMSVAGMTGVSLFFALSGFLITGVLLDTKDSAAYFRNFYARRALRLFPLYYVYLAILAWLVPPIDRALKIGVRHYEGPWWWYVTYLSNWKSTDFSDPALNHFWSLAVEEQFYVFWSVAIYWLPRKAVPWFCLIVAAASAGLRAVVVVSGAEWALAYKLTPMRLDCLALGGLASFLYREGRTLKSWLLSVVFSAGFVMVCLVSGGFEWDRPLVPMLGEPLLALAFSTLLLCATGRRPDWFTAFLEQKWLRSVGKYSYAIYLLHPLLISHLMWAWLRVARQAPATQTLLYWTFPVAVIAVTYWAARLSWYLLEEPCLRLKESFV